MNQIEETQLSTFDRALRAMAHIYDITKVETQEKITERGTTIAITERRDKV